MYNLPLLYNVQDYLYDTDLESIQKFGAPKVDYLKEFQKFVEHLIEDGLELPSDPNLQIYLLENNKEIFTVTLLTL